MCWCLYTYVFVCLFHHFKYSTSKLNVPNPAPQLVKQKAYTQFFNSCGEFLDYYELCALEIFQLSSFERAQHISTTFLPSPIIFCSNIYFHVTNYMDATTTSHSSSLSSLTAVTQRKIQQKLKRDFLSYRE